MVKTAKVSLSKKTNKTTRRNSSPTTKVRAPKKSNKTTRRNSSPKGVQKHGKIWENAIITAVVSPSQLDEALAQSHTARHDVPKHLNKKAPGINLSIKATGTNRVDFGDAKRTIQNLNNTNSPLEAVIINYRQSGTQKIPTSVLRINLIGAKEHLLGNDPNNTLSAQIDELDKQIKRGDPRYKETAESLKKYMENSGASLVIAPKIGNPLKGRSGRLQISLSNVKKFARDHPEHVVSETNCSVYGENCLQPLESSRRVFTPFLI